MVLDKLAIKHGTDKSSLKHNYTEVYEFMFKERRDKIRSLMEFGVFRGASLKMWADYFFYAQIHGVDIRAQNYTAPANVIHHVMDCTDSGIVQLTTKVDPDIVVDDAGHGMNQHQTTFELVFPFLKHGAIYVIEDLHTCYTEEHGGWKGHPGYDKAPNSNKAGKFGRTVDWLAELSHAVNFRGLEHPILKVFPYFNTIKAIHFYKSIVFIEKK